MNFYFIYKFNKLLKIICFLRAFVFINIFQKLDEIQPNENLSEYTIISNKRIILQNPNLKDHPRNKYLFKIGLNAFNTNIDYLINPFLKFNKRDIKDLKVLLIGPRSEAEVFKLLSHGFDKKKLISIDLFSYSSYIQIGDAHNLVFQNNKFDLIICGWVIAYSNQKSKLLNELIRVGKNDCIFLFGYSFNKKNKKEILMERKYLVSSPIERITSEEELKNLFKKNKILIKKITKFNTFVEDNNKYIIIGSNES